MTNKISLTTLLIDIRSRNLMTMTQSILRATSMSVDIVIH